MKILLPVDGSDAALDAVRSDVTKVLMTVQIRTEAQLEAAEHPPEMENVQYHHADYDEALGKAQAGEGAAGAQPHVNALPRVGRNEPCPCGSGKKYKHCHGKLN